MFIVCSTFLFGHGKVLQLLASLLKPWSRGAFADVAVLQVFHPLFKGGGGHFIELIDADDIVFRENLRRGAHAYQFTLFYVHLQFVTGMHPDEVGCTMIQVIAALAQVKIEDIDGIYFLDLVVLTAQRDVFSDGLGHTEQDTFQVVDFAR